MNSTPINSRLAISLIALLAIHAHLVSAQEHTSIPKPGGIGAMIEVIEGGVKISKILENSAAAEAGLVEGGTITSVNATPVKGLEIAQVTKLLIGLTDTQVTITYLAPGEANSQKIEVMRKPLDLPPHLLLTHGFTDLLRHKAKTGDVDSQVVLGKALVDGHASIKKDPKSGISLLAAAAAENDFEALKFLAFYYDRNDELTLAIGYFKKLVPLVDKKEFVKNRIKNLERLDSLMSLPTKTKDASTEKKIGKALEDDEFFKWLKANQHHYESISMKVTAAMLD